MANEQTSVPLFVADTILTAAQQNISAGTGVPVFATTVTRDAAFGGASEKVLAEGQLCYLSSTNVVQYYDGAAWATVGPAAASGLVCVKAETAFSAVASFTADGIFTSTYTNYRVLVRYTSTSDELAFQLGVSATYTTTGYNYERLQADGTTVDGGRSASQGQGFFAGSSSGSFFSYATLELSGVQLAAPTAYMSSVARNNAAYITPIIQQYNGNQSASTAFDGIKILTASGTTTGVYAVYGYSKTV